MFSRINIQSDSIFMDIGQSERSDIFIPVGFINPINFDLFIRFFFLSQPLPEVLTAAAGMPNSGPFTLETLLGTAVLHNRDQVQVRPIISFIEIRPFDMLHVEMPY